MSKAITTTGMFFMIDQVINQQLMHFTSAVHPQEVYE